MKLYLIQHGEALSKEQDPARGLSDKGESDIKSLAHFLNNFGFQVEIILHSGKLRAKQTAEIIANTIKLGVELESCGIINPNDDPKAFAWQDDRWDKDTLIISHLPFIGKLAAYLLTENENASYTNFTPGTMLCLNCDDKNDWTIEWMIRPELLA